MGGLDILVNNAGINIRKVIEEMSPEELDRMYGVNVKGPFLGIKHALPVMKKIGGGSIINISSVCGLIGHMYTPEAYTTTKGAVSLLTGGSLALRQVQHPLQFDQSEHGGHAAGAGDAQGPRAEEGEARRSAARPDGQHAGYRRGGGLSRFG